MSASALMLAWALAGQVTPAPTVATDAPPVQPEAFKKTRLAIMKLKAAGVPEEYASGLTETIATSAAATGVFETISPAQISSLLAYEKRKELLGGCLDEACYSQIGRAVKAPHLVAGTVSKVGDKVVLNLVLIDAGEGTALARTERDTTSASALMTSARRAATVVLQPLLESRQGFLRVAANVPDAGVVVDDQRRIEGVGQVIALAAGPHVLQVRKEGFYATTADVFVTPGRVTVENVSLIPAKDTIESYETKANLMRYGAYGTAVVAVGAAVVSGIFYGRATDNKNVVDTYSQALGSERATMPYDEVVAARNDFSTNQAVYVSTLTTAVVAAGVSLYLFFAGEDPARYEEYHSLNGL